MEDVDLGCAITTFDGRNEIFYALLVQRMRTAAKVSHGDREGWPDIQ
jgi:hypothetical protein